MSSLSHHGIKGQRWGVRRFQNKDGTRTAAGKKHEKTNRLIASTSKDYSSIKKSLSDHDLKMLNYDDEEIKYMREHDTLGHDHAEYGQTAHRVIQKDKNGIPVAYVDATGFTAQSLLTGKMAAKVISIDLATRAGDEYRGKGYAIAAGKKMVKWFDTYGYKDYEYMEWAAKEENVASQKVAEKLGFKNYHTSEPGWTLYTYERKAKHTSIGGTMYIEGNALILGDSSYLEHHGIRGQRWGVRRFQNADGSLTNVGRKRLGYATKGATQAVKKAFKAGVKTGTKAVKAAKAHHEKAEAKKIEKKKEKASKTRAGVSANKDLFSAKELKDLNSKFEEQDKLRAARLKQGLEVVKAVGEVAKTAKQVGDAYQSITGKSILGHITETKNEKEAAAKKVEDDAKEQAAKDLQEARNKDAAKRALQANIDKYKQQKDDEASEARVKEAEKQGNKAAAKVKLAEYIDRYNQDKSAQEATKQMLKNQKLQENIDKFNQAQREKDAATLKATTDQGKKILGMLERHGTDADLFKEDYQNRMANSSSSSSNPKPPTGGNLMAQIKAAQAKLKKPNKNETPAEQKEAQKKLNALEKVANEYKAAANKPGADPAEVTEKLLKKNKDILDEIKHMDFSDEVYLEHYGVRGMKWGKHLMAGKGGGLYDGTALGAGGGGGPMTEEERKKVEALKKKKLEEAKKKAEAAAKEKEIEEKAKEIGVSVKAYKNYSIDKNHLPGKHHYTTSNKLHGEAEASVAEAQAAERQAHMNRAKAASLMRKVNSSHMFDADGYHISQQRGDDRNEAKQLKKEAKQLDKASQKALKKFYKKRYKSDKERQKWHNSTSGKYHHLMRHYEIQNGVLFIDSSDHLSHHGVKGQKWGVRRFQNPDGSLTEKGRKHYEKAIEKLDRKQVNSDNRRGALERQHPFAVTASAILTGSAYAALMVASAANPAMVVAGSAIAAAVSALGTHVDYSVAEAWEGRGTKRRQKKRKEYEEMLNHDGLMVLDGTLYLEHHGIRGQRCGVRRFQNPDGTRTEAGKKRDAKLAAKAEKKAAKIAAKDAKRSAKAEKIRAKAVERYERKAALSRRESEAEAYKLIARDTKKASQKELLSDQKVSTAIAVGQGILGAIGLATYGVPTVAAIAGGAAIVGIMRNYNLETVRTNKTLMNLKGAEKARLAKSRATDQIMDDWREEGLGVRHFAIQNGTLFIDAGEPYLEHHGVLGMKWGKHLRAGKGPADAPASAGGGGGEDDEKLKEMAKKAGMSVAEYKQKFASKLGGAASKVGSAVYDAAGGSHKKNAEGWRKMAREESNAARASEKSAHENSAKAASQDRKYGSGGDVYRRAADSDKENAKTHHSNAKARSERAASEQAAYEKSLAGRYDKMKADRARKKSAKEKKRLQTQTSAEAKRISVKDKHLVINGNRSVGTRGLAVGETGEKPKSFKERAYNALGGKYKTQAADAHREMVQKRNDADDKARRANAQGRAANAQKRAGNVREYIANKEGARQLDAEAKGARTSQWEATKKANRAQWKYDHSIAGLYDKATGKYKQAHKKTAIPKTMDRWMYELKDGPNSKLFNNGKGKAKTAKEQAKAEVWNAADHQIKAKEYNDVANSVGGNANYYGQAYKNAAEREGRLSEASYRRAAALAKQTSSESSTSSRPRARKKKHTSGGSGVAVRRPGRKPVSRTKRITQSSTGVKRRGSTGSGRSVRRGA